MRRGHLRLGRHAHAVARHRLRRGGARAGRAPSSAADDDAAERPARGQPGGLGPLARPPHQRHARRHVRRGRADPRRGAAARTTASSGSRTRYTDPDVLPLFSRLRLDGLKVGVLSNTLWPREWHEEFFRRDGVLDLIDGAVYTSEIPWTKPAPEAFQAAAAGGRRRPTRPRASSSATASSTTSGAPPTSACAPSTSRTATSRSSRSATPRASPTRSCSGWHGDVVAAWSSRLAPAQSSPTPGNVSGRPPKRAAGRRRRAAPRWPTAGRPRGAADASGVDGRAPLARSPSGGREIWSVVRSRVGELLARSRRATGSPRGAHQRGQLVAAAAVHVVRRVQPARQPRAPPTPRPGRPARRTRRPRRARPASVRCSAWSGVMRAPVRPLRSAHALLRRGGGHAREHPGERTALAPRARCARRRG